MKKIVSFLVCFTLLLSVTSCFGPKPEDTVTNMFESLKSGTYDDLDEFFTDSADPESVFDLFDDSDAMATTFKTYFTENAKSLEYTIGEVEKTSNGAVSVSVDVTYVDGSEVLTDTFQSYIEEAFSLMFSEDFSEEKANQILIDTFNEKTAAAQPTTATKSLVFILTQDDDKEWKISNANDDFIDVITNNFMSTINAMSGLLQ